MNRLTLAVVAAIALQAIILTGMYVSASLPMITGQEVRVKTIPVDPRSLFRGNYAYLNYGFATIPAANIRDSESLRVSDVVYVTLEAGDSGLHEFKAASTKKPELDLFLRGRIDNLRSTQNADIARIKFGIEAYFAPEEQALRLERSLRDGGIAVLMVDSDGRARIKAVEPLTDS